MLDKPRAPTEPNFLGAKKAAMANTANSAAHPQSHKIGLNSFIMIENPTVPCFSEEYALSLMIPTNMTQENTDFLKNAERFQEPISREAGKHCLLGEMQHKADLRYVGYLQREA